MTARLVSAGKPRSALRVQTTAQPALSASIILTLIPESTHNGQTKTSVAASAGSTDSVWPITSIFFAASAAERSSPGIPAPTSARRAIGHVSLT